MRKIRDYEKNGKKKYLMIGTRTMLTWNIELRPLEQEVVTKINQHYGEDNLNVEETELIGHIIGDELNRRSN